MKFDRLKYMHTLSSELRLKLDDEISFLPEEIQLRIYHAIWRSVYNALEVCGAGNPYLKNEERK